MELLFCLMLGLIVFISAAQVPIMLALVNIKTPDKAHHEIDDASDAMTVFPHYFIF